MKDLVILFYIFEEVRLSGRIFSYISGASRLYQNTALIMIRNMGISV
jgi:hypothetical protein